MQLPLTILHFGLRYLTVCPDSSQHWIVALCLVLWALLIVILIVTRKPPHLLCHSPFLGVCGRRGRSGEKKQVGFSRVNGAALPLGSGEENIIRTLHLFHIWNSFLVTVNKTHCLQSTRAPCLGPFVPLTLTVTVRSDYLGTVMNFSTFGFPTKMSALKTHPNS